MSEAQVIAYKHSTSKTYMGNELPEPRVTSLHGVCSRKFFYDALLRHNVENPDKVANLVFKDA